MFSCFIYNIWSGGPKNYVRSRYPYGIATVHKEPVKSFGAQLQGYMTKTTFSAALFNWSI